VSAALAGDLGSRDTWFAKMLAARPVNAEGSPVCERCKTTPVAEQEFACRGCTEKAAADERARELNEKLKIWLDPARATLPGWDFLDVEHPMFAPRVKHPALRTAAKKWTSDKGSLMLSGPAGIGKTVSAATIAWRLVRDGESAARAAGVASQVRVPAFKIATRVRWVSALDLIAARRGHPLGRGECALWETAATAGVLFLDEVGQEQAQAGWLLELLDARYRRGVPTVTSSGLTKDELEKRYGSGAVRRLVEPGGVWIDAFGGPGGG